MIEVPDANQERRLRPGWWARLEGESFDLVALHEALGDSGGVLVRRYDGRYYLRMAEFDEIAQSDAIETRAAEVLRVANGAAASSTLTTGKFAWTPWQAFSLTARSETSYTSTGQSMRALVSPPA